MNLSNAAQIPAYIKKSIINVYDSNSGEYACIFALFFKTKKAEASVVNEVPGLTVV